MTIKEIIGMPKLSIEKIESLNSIVKIYASIKSNRSKCPKCARFSSVIHDHYLRSIADLPAFQNRTVLLLKTRKFRCKNPGCKQRVFSEQTPYVHRYSRRTKRATAILNSFSIELSGRLGSSLSEQLLLKVSISTITRIAYRQELPEIGQPKILGVDDWAYRKGIRYGTILIDMETSRPVDILPSREGNELKNWLKKYPDVRVFTRDRSSSYSSAINEVCPAAIQVADRFHLLLNLSDALDSYFKSIRVKVDNLIKEKSANTLNTNGDRKEGGEFKDQYYHISLIDQEASNIKIDQRLETFNKVKELQSKQISVRKISRDLRVSRNTVKSYFAQESLQPRTRPKSTNIELFTPHIVARLNQRGYTVKEIIRDIVKLGYNGSQTQAYCNIKLIKENSNITTPDFTQAQRIKIPFTKPLPSRKLAKYIGSSITEIVDPEEQKYMQILLRNIPELQIIRKLVQIFKTMLKRGRGNIRRWIEFIKGSRYKLTGIRTFASGLLRDIDAVENGINMKWSNGAVEGHVNRIKSKKRQMYGRASFDLLRRKVILSTTG